jgi:hypothetical protein
LFAIPAIVIIGVFVLFKEPNTKTPMITMAGIANKKSFLEGRFKVLCIYYSNK